ncbi:hypothetical protein KI387_019414 [Taxus chinensis]|uniref:Helicase ATP-binding domain-containing protein n=1 Tax=Taxus chinensis TaxID=29808 RepID=A0AA38LDJ5_TAXCH|nr:hypothetical protein KI387_019414 [Taxus chinensis]
MGKGEDAIAKKRSKATRKRLRKDLATSSEHINGIIAAKRRKKDQKRRMCRGMCYSLPTPENPFNDVIEHSSQKKQGGKKKVLSETEVKKQKRGEKRDAGRHETSFAEEEINNSSQKKKKRKKDLMDDTEASQLQKTVFEFDKVCKPAEDGIESKQKKDKLSRRASSHGHCRIAEDLSNLQINAIPEMVLKLSLDAIRKIELEDGIMPVGFQKLTLNNKWGTEFWNAYLKGSNILGISKASFDLEQTAWIVSAAASHVINKSMRDSVIRGPMVLYIVASQEHARKVRMLFKPLKKILGIRSVSLHPGASIGHQVEGLRICIPEILVSTPERLLELIELEALDLSSISFLVIDGLKNILEGDFAENLKALRFHMSGNPQKAVLSNTYTGMSTALAQYILKDPIHRVSSDSSIILQSACIAQAVSVFTSEDKKVQKVLKILKQINDEKSTLLVRIVIVVNNAGKAQEVVAAMEHEGYFVNSFNTDLQVQEKIPGDSENNRLQILITTENLLQEDKLSEAQVLIIYDFPPSLQSYSKLLTGMARFSVMGILYSFCSGVNAPLAAQLIKLLDECLQPIPKTLRMLADAASTIQH